MSLLNFTTANVAVLDHPLVIALSTCHGPDLGQRLPGQVSKWTGAVDSCGHCTDSSAEGRRTNRETCSGAVAPPTERLLGI